MLIKTKAGWIYFCHRRRGLSHCLVSEGGTERGGNNSHVTHFYANCDDAEHETQISLGLGLAAQTSSPAEGETKYVFSFQFSPPASDESVLGDVVRRPGQRSDKATRVLVYNRFYETCGHDTHYVSRHILARSTAQHQIRGNFERLQAVIAAEGPRFL